MSTVVNSQWKARIAEGLARKGKDPRTGHFLPGNRLGKGRPHRSEIMIRTYGQAVSRACPPETLYQVVAKAVEHALGSGRHCDGARMFLLKVLGADQIKVYLNGLHGLNGSAPGATYNLDALDDKELATLDALGSKMMIERSCPMTPQALSSFRILRSLNLPATTLR